MSSETSTKRVNKPAQPFDDTVPGFQPWHLFLIGTLVATAAAAVAVRGTRPANVIFVCLTVLAAGAAAYALYRTLWPLVQPGAVEVPEMLGGRTRAALEREKTLTLHAIKELEFDRAMGKVSESDWQEMTAKLRGRAIRVIRQLDSGSAAYRDLIDRELAARRAAPPRPGAENPTDVAGLRGAAKLLIVLVVGGTLVAAPARAQMTGTGAVAGMPDARAMSGIPRPDPSLPTGTVSVRLVRGQISNVVVGHPVEFLVGGKSEHVTTDETGHAAARGFSPGAMVRVVATIDGERIDSEEFQVPAQGGVVVMLVASDRTAAVRMAKDAVEGTVTIGGQSRIATQFEDEELQVYYVFDIVNRAQAPVKTREPLIFDLPADARNATVLEGSAPGAVAKGIRVTVAGPFPPGATSLQVAFSMPPVSRVSIRQKLPVAMEQVVVMAEKVGPVVLSSAQLTTIREGSEGGKVFVLGTGPGLKAGDVLSLDISGLPHPASWPRNAALAFGVLALAAGAWGAARTGGRSAESVARQQLEMRREQAFGELLALDDRQKSGRASPEAAEEQRGQLLAELERIYGELDTDERGTRGEQGMTV